MRKGAFFVDEQKKRIEEEMLEAAEKAYNEAVENGEVSVTPQVEEEPDEVSEQTVSEDRLLENEPLPKKQKEEETPVSTDRTVICCAAGLVLGTILGFIVSSIPLCIICGVILGLILGLLLDNRKDKNMAQIENKKIKGNE